MSPQSEEQYTLIYELRTYTAAEGKMPDLLTRFRENTIDIFDRYGMESIGYWIRADDPDVLVYLLRHSGTPEDNWTSFKTDPQWIRARETSLANGPLTTHMESVYLQPAEIHAQSLLGQRLEK